MDYKEYVFYSLIGALLDPHPEVENMFADDKLCKKLYEDMFDAYCSVCKRLGENDDYEVEKIVTYLTLIQREVALKMYDYGAEFGKV